MARGDALVATYDPANGTALGDGFSDLYFDVFEASGLEQAIGAVSPDTKTELEALFGQIIGRAGQGLPKNKIEGTWHTLRDRLQAVTAARLLAGTGPVAAFVQSFLILLREGVEAMLVIAALVAGLHRSGQGDGVKVVWRGAGWALAASLATAWLLSQALHISGQGQEVLEGVVMLVAALVLFHVSFWLLSKRESAHWQACMKAKVDAAASGGRVWALGLVAFLTVFREGAETVLFYQALILSAPGETLAVAAGFVAAAAVVALLYWAMRGLSFRLPLKWFFTATAALLFTLAISFAGKGVLVELQEGRLVPITPLDGLPHVAWLGLFPTVETVETVAAQIVLSLPMLAALAWHVARRRAAA
ncbi:MULTISPECIES: FTR1 family iron permease [Azospirillum]|uniref:FTR1 family protein n=1 Tax=Azospirillum brasilense TaxID=192 RepID=A0ABU4PF62_AZOBR|nr:MULTISPECIES: FTR1 family protein [Azospirillum]ALJ39438.1 hypothetical protein AMK58_28515 [Azospirillum brasilense]MDX5955941.1 FTR1 family protein [Azospirillum brasilense]